jgi:hypothetical protein
MATRLPMPVDVDRHVLNERIWINVRKGNGCWIWTGNKRGEKYASGQIKIRNSLYGVTRIIWWIEHREWPGELSVLHKCDNPLCCRPSHLRLGTHAENMADMVAKGRSNARYGIVASAIARSTKPFCVNGHDFALWGRRAGGTLRCMMCRRIRDEAYREKRRKARGG